jgi:2-deoxy-D-gluconate 3-dehydrogenase
MGVLDSFRLDGKTALVTGSAAGLGAAIAIALAEAGADVVTHGNRRPATETSSAIAALGRKTVALSGDLSSPSGADDLYGRAVGHFPQIDILVNNAGVILRANAEDSSPEDWNTVLQVNLTSVFRLSQLAGKSMLQRGFGKIINIASLLSFQGGIRVPAYSASKGGVAQLTKALSNEWASRGVRVNAIAPGYFRTENTRALQEDAARNRQIVERIPAGDWGVPIQLGGAAVFLASSASDYVSGEVLVVDGGWMAR